MKRGLFRTIAAVALLGAAACGGDEPLEEESEVTDIEVATPGGASLDTLSPGIMGAGPVVSGSGGAAEAPNAGAGDAGPGDANVELPDSGAAATPLPEAGAVGDTAGVP